MSKFNPQYQFYVDKDGAPLRIGKTYYCGRDGLSEDTLMVQGEPDDQALAMAEKYPAYWRTLPKHWLAVDTYRVNRLFPVDDPSGQLLHSRKKLLVPGCRTGGKSVYDDIKEAHATLGAWLADNKPE